MIYEFIVKGRFSSDEADDGLTDLRRTTMKARGSPAREYNLSQRAWAKHYVIAIWVTKEESYDSKCFYRTAFGIRPLFQNSVKL